MLKPDQTTKIKELYKKGLTLREISKIIPCPQSTIMRILKKNKVKLRGEHCQRIDRKKLKKLPDEYLSGKTTIRDLMKKYGIGSEQTFYKIIKNEFNLPLIMPSRKH